MTSPSPMSCETCQDLLIELVCDELALELAAAVRAHALKCERCGPELEKLTKTLKASSALGLLSPSPEVEHRIMQAAREAIAGRARGPAREAATAGPNYGGITEWFARLGSFAMSPQVAMASVLLLVVGIGLYALPFGRHAAEQGALRATEDEGDHRPAAPSPAASATATPVEEHREEGVAEPEDMAARGRGAPEREQSRGLGSQRAGRASESAAKAGKGRASDMELARDSKKERAVSAFPGSAEARGAAREESQAARPESKGSSGAVAAKPKAAGKAQSESADDFAPAPASSGSKPSAQPNTSGPGEAGPAKSAPAAAPATAARAEPTSQRGEQAKGDTSAALDQGIAAAKRGDHAQAEALLKPIALSGSGSDRSTAMLWLARSRRARGDCAAALTFYRTLTQPLSAPRAVLEEAADCHERTGNAAAAERLRARAALPAKQ